MSLQIGDPAEPGTRVGPVIDARAQASIQQFMIEGQRESRLLVQCPVKGGSHLVGPTVFIDVESHHQLAQEEIFDSVLAVMRADGAVSGQWNRLCADGRRLCQEFSQSYAGEETV